MALWWFGNIVFLFVIIPVVAWLLIRLLRPAEEIGRYVDDIHEHAINAVNQLDAVGQLSSTSSSAGQVADGLRRYADALQRAL